MSAAEWSDGAAGPVLALFDELTEPGGTWQDSALCAQSDPEAWFPEKGGSTKEAKAICWRCPVLAQCREFILRPENDDVARFGIWAGLSERDRRRLKSRDVSPVHQWRQCGHQRKPGDAQCVTCQSDEQQKAVA